MPRFKKADVQFHSDMGRDPHPAVNIKVEGSPYDITLPFCTGGISREGGKVEWQYSDEGFTHEWIESLPESTRNSIWEMVCEIGFGELRSYAKTEVWPDNGGVEVWQEGRSGGWAVVFGLKDFDSWNAVDVARWAKFVKYANALVKDIPYQYVSSIYMNEWEARELDPDLKYHYACVNEDGEMYDEFDELQPALAKLTQFPNDSVVITIAQKEDSNG